MNATTSQSTGEIRLLRQQAGMIRHVVGLSVDGLTQAETLIQPQPAGNCMNWVVGHLLTIYQQVLPLIGQEPVIPNGKLKQYNRGSQPIRDSGHALDISDLMTAWGETCARIDSGFAALTSEDLDRPAPFSPTDNPNETIASLLTTVCWHQAYHAGQTGLLRRLAGKDGAIR